LDFSLSLLVSLQVCLFKHFLGRLHLHVGFFVLLHLLEFVFEPPSTKFSVIVLLRPLLLEDVVSVCLVLNNGIYLGLLLQVLVLPDFISHCLGANDGEGPPAVHDGAGFVELNVVDCELVTALHSPHDGLLVTVDQLFKHLHKVAGGPLVVPNEI